MGTGQVRGTRGGDGAGPGVAGVGTDSGRRTHAVAAPGCRGPWDMASLGWAGPRTEAGRGQGVPPVTPMGTPGRCPGRPAEGGGSWGGEVLGREAPRSFVVRSSPGGRAPQPPPRAGPDFPALFTSEKTFPGPGMRRRSNQAPAPAPAPMLMTGAQSSNWLRTPRKAGSCRLASARRAVIG